MALAAVLGGYWIALAKRGAQRERARLLAAHRARAAHSVAVSAALDEPAFDPEQIRAATSQIFVLAKDLAQHGDTRGLAGRSDRSAISVWAQSHAGWLAQRKYHDSDPSIELLRIVNRSGEHEDRAIVRVRLRSHASTTGLDERWTLGRRSGQWTLLSADGDPLAKSLLDEPMIAGESDDLDRLREQSMAELAQADRAPPGARLSELTSPKAPVERQLLDLATVDGRFDPELVDSGVRQLVETWEEATTGSPQPLHHLATKSACHDLLHPVAGANLILQDAELQGWKPTALDLTVQPPRLEISLEIAAIRYLADSTTLEHRAGARDLRHTLSLTWTFTATTAVQVPWRLDSSSNPASDIPGA